MGKPAAIFTRVCKVPEGLPTHRTPNTPIPVTGRTGPQPGGY